MGRRKGLDPSRHGEFAVWWSNPLVPVTSITEHFGICAPTIYAERRRLGLPDRASIREAHGLSRHGPLVVAPDVMPPATDPKGPEATLWRCQCGGRTDNRLGHTACQGRAA